MQYSAAEGSRILDQIAEGSKGYTRAYWFRKKEEDVFVVDSPKDEAEFLQEQSDREWELMGRRVLKGDK